MITANTLNNIFKKSKSLAKNIISYGILFLFSAFLLFTIYFVWIHFSNFGYLSDDNRAALGQLGDFTGGFLNPIVAFAALLGLSYTIVLQRKQMKKAEKDFKVQSEAQNEQLRHAAEAFQSQKLAQEKQAFESTFFQLLAIFSGVARDEGIKGEINQNSSNLHKNTHIHDLMKEVNPCHDFLERNIDKYNKEKLIEYDILYIAYYEKYEFILGHYFRVLFNIIKFIDRSTLIFDEKKFYTNLVRSQLSQLELSLLFYNGLSKHGREKFLPLIHEYSLLKHLENSKSDPDIYNIIVSDFLDVQNKSKP